MERRAFDRKTARFPVRFRIVREGSQMRISEPTEGTARDLAPDGISVETQHIVFDGLHISYDEHPATKNRVYLQFDLPTRQTIKAVGETVWYERISTAEPWFVVGLRFVEITGEDRKALTDYLQVTALGPPLTL
jgi:hypothetical protein